MNEELKNLIAESVIKNVIFVGTVGTAYTVQELIHTASTKTIDAMWRKTKKELESIGTESLFNSSGSSKTKELQFQLDVLQAVFNFKQEQAKAEREAEKIKQERAEKLATLKSIKSKIELEELGKLTLDQINEEIEKYSK